jgi:hypothetical protein
LRAGRTASILIALIAAALAAAELSAHRRDELLQAARVAFEGERLDVELDLTPGIEVAEAFIADVDLDRDAALSVDEQSAYCRRVAAAIHLELDGRPLQLQPPGCTFPALGAIRTGEGTIQLRAAAPVPERSVGDHQLLFRNTFQPAGSVYLANALVPTSDAVAVTAQHRDADQRSLAIDYRIRPRPVRRLPLRPLGAVGVGALTLMILVRRELATAIR